MPDNYETEEEKRQRLLREQAKQTLGQTIGYPGSPGVPDKPGLFDRIKKMLTK